MDIDRPILSLHYILDVIDGILWEWEQSGADYFFCLDFNWIAERLYNDQYNEMADASEFSGHNICLCN